MSYTQDHEDVLGNTVYLVFLVIYTVSSLMFLLKVLSYCNS